MDYYNSTTGTSGETPEQVNEILRIRATGASISSTSSSSSVSIPVTSTGAAPNRCRVTAAISANIKLGVGSAVATADYLMLGAGKSIVLDTAGYDKIASISASDGVVQISPIEN